MRLPKLVRDRIPDLIMASGRMALTRHLSDEEFDAALRAKLVEEAEETSETSSPDGLVRELADVVEVVRALAGRQGFTLEDVLRAAHDRREQRGAFDERILLEDVR
jgi:predicted house-cleaning noncanonical NTP pyrophosphatase (MazG superfamily)